MAIIFNIKVVSCLRIPKRVFKVYLCFFRCNNLKLTNKLWDFVKSEVVYKKIDANILIFKVKKELESKVSLDNEILD